MCLDCGDPGSAHYVLGVAYPPDMDDGHGEYMTPDTVRKTAWGFLRKGAKIGLHHADGTEGAGTVVESYIYQGPDWEVAAPDGSTQVVKAGQWLLGVEFTPAAWRLVKSGRVNGWSIQGLGRRRTHPTTTPENSR